jgi:hypothetical protein
MRQILDADCGSDEDCLVLGAKRGNGYTQDELREACVLTSKLLPPRVFAKVMPHRAPLYPARAVGCAGAMSSMDALLVARACRPRAARPHTGARAHRPSRR